MKIVIKNKSSKLVIKFTDYEISKLQLDKDSLLEMINGVCKAIDKERSDVQVKQ